MLGQVGALEHPHWSSYLVPKVHDDAQKAEMGHPGQEYGLHLVYASDREMREMRRGKYARPFVHKAARVEASGGERGIVVARSEA
jgi:hypothetical protein